MNTDSKRLSLKQSLVDFLNTQEGKKCPIKSIWQDLQGYTKKPVSAKNYGVTKMNQLLDLNAFKDVISCENNYVTLRSVTASVESLERRGSFQLQHDKVLVPHFETVEEGWAQTSSRSSTTESPLKSFPQFHLSGDVPTVSVPNPSLDADFPTLAASNSNIPPKSSRKKSKQAPSHSEESTSQHSTPERSSHHTTTALAEIEVLSLENDKRKTSQVVCKSKEKSRLSAESWPATPVRSGCLPGTKIDDFHKEIVVKCIHLPKDTCLTTKQVDEEIKLCIEVLHNARKFVNLKDVETMLLKKFQVRRFQDLKLPVNNFYKMESAVKHSRDLCKVDLFIETFLRGHSTCTLYEIMELCDQLDKDQESFESLKLGPIQSLPVIWKHFKFPQDEHVPDITTGDVMEHLYNYLNEKQLWTQKTKIDDFMLYLTNEYAVSSPFSLGVKIGSLPLAIQSLKKSNRDMSTLRRKLVEQLRDVFCHDIKVAFRWFQDSILQEPTNANDVLKLRQHYVTLTPEVTFEEIFRKFELLASITLENSPRTYKKIRIQIEEFIKVVLRDPLACLLYHLSVCLSDLQVQEKALEYFQKLDEQDQDNGHTQNKKVPPSRVLLVQKVAQHLTSYLQNGSLNLTHLRKIESDILDEFDFQSFPEMDSRTFLDIIVFEEKIKKIFDDCGGTALGSTSGSHETPALFRPSLKHLLDFMCQAQSAGATKIEQKENCICQHYQVSDIRHLGHGNIARLRQAAEKSEKNLSKEHNVCFESALCAKASTETQSKVGIRGTIKKEAALACLTTCPLLEDMAEWSHWSLVFQPQLGCLRHFIEKHGGRQSVTLEGGHKMATSDFKALEVAPGTFLKISSDGSLKDLKSAVETGDALTTAGQLVSLIVANKGLKNTQLALVSEQIKTKLILLHAQSSPKQESLDSAVLFITQILLKLPTKICVEVANQVLLKPLGDVVGSDKSKKLIHLACEAPWQQQKLELLGCLLGLPEWTSSLDNKLLFPQNCVEDISDELFAPDELLAENDEENEITDSSYSDDEDQLLDLTSETKPAVDLNLKASNSAHLDSSEDEDLQNKENDVNNKEELPSNENLALQEDKLLAREEKCRLVVEEIRREEFGVGVELTEAGSKLMKTLQDRQGRSLQRLSKDLYSKETHFVLELIQNADDNKYQGEVTPSVKFLIDEKGVTVLNNEEGFEEQNIRAICDVGKSTKSKHTLGYIGQKGIGFKSVFRVTTRPEVHSNGYHIYFDVNSGPMGYILPHWSHDSKQGDTEWQTKIILPWTEEIRQQIRTHAARFNDIKPSLLLFLHRLKKISIDNKVEGAETFMVRKDLPNGEIHISHNHGTDKWFVLKKVLDTSGMSLQAKSGAEVECTEIALAFPLKNISTINSQVKYEMQPVFAFLPLRSFGFRFIIQGDFDVPSSREDIDQDSAWNQWLRDEIHLLFLEAFEAFKTKPDIPALEAFVMYLQFIPLEGELLDFFKPVSTQILRQLKAKECVPVLSKDSKSIVWKIPSKTVITHDKLVLRMISPERLQKELDLYYLHPDVAKVLSEPLLHALGINSVTAEHLLQLGQAISQNFKHTDIEEIANWLACLYRHLDEYQDNSELFETLQNMKIIPLSNGELVSLTQTTVFLLIGTDQSGPSKKKQKADKSRDPLEKLKTDLNLVHFDLVNTHDNEINSQVVKLLQRMGIKQLTAHDLIHSHIMPVLRSDQWRDKHPDIMVSYLVYIKSELDNNPSILDKSELRSVIKLVTNHGVKSPVDVDIHFSTAYGTKIDLFHLLPGIDWVLLDSSYLPIPHTQHDKDTWRSFLQDLGVVDFLKVREVELQVDEINMQELADLPDGYTILDFQCEEFYNLLNNNQQPDTMYEQMGQVFELLNREWESQYQNYVCKEIRYKNGKVHKKTQSTFGKQLQSLPWLPTYSTKVTFDKQSKQLDFQEFHKLQSPVQLYLKQDNIQRLLADTVQYLDVKSQKDTLFTKFLNIKSNITAEMVKENLISWCTREEDDVPVTFCTRVWHFFEVYAYLEVNLKPNESQNLFHTHPAIFVPLTECDGAGEFCAGLMMRRDEVWWSDYDGLFLKYQPSLDLYKSPLRKFRTLEKMYQEQYKMVKKLFRIQKEPNALYLAELLKHICTIHTLSEEGVLADSLNILSKIGNDLSHADDIEGGVPTNFALEFKKIFPQVMETLQESSMFPTKSNLWVSMEDGPMIADDAELAEMFNSKPGVHFLQLDTRGSHRFEKKTDGTMGNEYLAHLFTLLDVKKLSDCVTMEAVTLMFLPYSKGQTYLHTVVGLLQSFLYTYYPEVYRRVKEKKSGQLKELLVCQVDELKIKYSLTGHEKVTVEKEMDCFVIDKHFYIQKDFIADMDVINHQIAKYFSDGDNSCCREIGRLLPTKASFLDHPSEEFLAKLFERNKLEDLAADEEAWVVSLPVIPVSPEPEPEEEMMVYGKGTDTEDATTVVECHERQSWPPKLGQEFDPLVVLKIDGNRADNIWPPPAPPEGFISPPQPTITYRSGETTTNISSSATEDSDERFTEDVKQLTGSQPRDHGSTTVSRSSSVLEGPDIHTRIQGEQINKDNQEFQGFEDPSNTPVESTEKKAYFDTFGQTSRQHGANHGGVNFFNEPVWTETNKELDYTELKCEQNLITSLQTLADDASLIEVGQWGEKLVWNFLQQQRANGIIVDVKWANVDSERGLPYDFTVTCLTDDPNKTKTIYIEVKTTKHWSRENFRISYNQTELAIQQKENFEIYRVYGAGSPSSKLIRIENVAEKMHQQQLRLYLVV